MKRQHQTTPEFGSLSKIERYSAKRIEQNYNNHLKDSKRHKYYSTEEFFRASCSDRNCPEKLKDISAKICALTLPYEAVEEKISPVPELVIKKLIFWSFPRSENDIRRYSAMCDCVPILGEEKCEGCCFKKGVQIVEKQKVKNVLQIGFRLMGEVENIETEMTGFNHAMMSEKTGIYHKTSITFDRCKITSATCDCEKNDIFFCSHVVALSLFRIHNPDLVTMRPPISDTLQQLDKNQLRKLAQYIFAEHSQVLPQAHLITELLINPYSDLNAIDGAPDPSAGAALTDDNKWALGDQEVKLHFTNLLQSAVSFRKMAGKVEEMLNKVVDMLFSRDCNGPHLLMIMTEELLNFVLSYDGNKTCIIELSCVWKSIGELWTSIVLNPNKTISHEIASKLKEWDSRLAAAAFLEEKQRAELAQLVNGNYSIFSLAIRVISIKWDDSSVKDIFRKSSSTYKAIEKFELDSSRFQKNKDMLQQEEIRELERKEGVGRSRDIYIDPGNEIIFVDKIDSSLLWDEPLHIAIARMETLHCHGYTEEAGVLAFIIAQTIKHNSVVRSPSDLRHAGDHSHRFELIKRLVDVLMVAKNVQENLNQDNFQCNNNYKCLAFEVILLSLADRTSNCLESEDRLVLLKRGVIAEQALLDLLKTFEIDYNLYMEHELKNIVQSLPEYDNFEENYIPFCRFANHIWEKLLEKYPILVLDITLLAMENSFPEYLTSLPDTESEIFDAHKRYFGQHSHSETSKCFIIKQFETDLYDLALNLIKSAQDLARLPSILICLLQNVKNPEHLLQLAQEAYKIAKEIECLRDMQMLNAAIQLCKQALVLTMNANQNSREKKIKFLINCGAESGMNTFIDILKSSHEYFTPVETVSCVADFVTSTNLSSDQKEELQTHVCRMALASAKKDPKSCALPSLKLCKNQPTIFTDTYEIIVEAASKNQMEPLGLYKIARYLKECDFPDRALTIGYAATFCLKIEINDSDHPTIDDLLWTMKLGLEKPELLKDLVEKVCDNVKEPTVLAGILQIFIPKDKSSNSEQTENDNETGFKTDDPVIQPLVEAAIKAFTDAIDERLVQITSSRYSRFVTFLKKASEIFLLVENGRERFDKFRSNLQTVHKRKKKLIKLIHLQFDGENSESG